MRIIFSTFLLLISVAAHAQGTLASDEVDISTYLVTGNNLAEVESQMERKGPNGFWAYTDVSWRWDGKCNVILSSKIVMPQLQFRNRLTDAEQAEWDRMHAALLAHEMEHVEIGRQTALWVKAANCRVDSDAVQTATRAAMVELDDRTNHGTNTGATLRY